MNVDAEIETGLNWQCQWFKDEKVSGGLLLSNSSYPPCCNFHHSWKNGAKIWLHFAKCQETPLALQQKKERGKDTNFNSGCGLGEGEMAEGERKWLSVASQTFPEVAKQVGEMRPDPGFPRRAFQSFPAKWGKRKAPSKCLQSLPSFFHQLLPLVWSRWENPAQGQLSRQHTATALSITEMGKSDFPLPQLLPSVSPCVAVWRTSFLGQAPLYHMFEKCVRNENPQIYICTYQ